MLAGGRGAAGAVHDVPAQEAFEGYAGLLLLLLRLPGRVEDQPVPDRVEPLHEDGQIGGRPPGGHLVGQDVDDVAETLGRGRRGVGLHLAAQEPLEGAGVGQLVERAAGQGDGLVPVAQRDGRAGRLVQAPPPVGVGRRYERLPLVVAERREPGEAVGGLLAQRVGGAWVDGGGAQLGDEGGDGQGRRGRPVTSRGSTPSSVRKRDGWSPSSAGALTAVTIRRSRARVAAT